MKNRRGSYKNVLISETELSKYELKIKNQLNDIKSLNISSQDFTTLYLLLFLRLIHPKNYLQMHTKNFKSQFGARKLLEIIPESFELSDWEKEKLKDCTGLDLFYHFNLRAIPKSIHRTMIHWYEEKWKIILTHNIPTPHELLSMQAQNARVLTLIINESKITKLILGKRDPLSFALHDLMHADQFFNNPDSAKGQLGFYQIIFKNYNYEELQNLISTNQSFKDEFDYVVSDMNAYIIHLLKSFKSCFTRHQSESIFYNFFTQSNLNTHELNVLKKINQKDLTLDEEILIKNFFENSQEYYR